MERIGRLGTAAPSRYRDSSSHLSPLRYPGGKRKLANFLRLLVWRNDLLDGQYAEVYAGGAAVGLSLLFGEYVERIHINDLDPGVHAFWVVARNDPDVLCRRIAAAKLDIGEWRKQRELNARADAEPVDLAFSTFYLNRTNRSGIIAGGPIGGYQQGGTWRLSARFAKGDLIARIQRVARYKSRIRIYNLDAEAFIQQVASKLSTRSLLYLDPPYLVKGKTALYANYYQLEDHARIARLVASLTQPWVVSYDDTAEVRQLYADARRLDYGISYSANQRYHGREVMFFSEKLAIPNVEDPSRFTRHELLRIERKSAPRSVPAGA